MEKFFLEDMLFSVYLWGVWVGKVVCLDMFLGIKQEYVDNIAIGFIIYMFRLILFVVSL